ncbi:hypothetical protein CLV93_104120 [Prolixibacter denitrificans]|uniref:ATP-grasp domain-containing protein n=2 Tax=Prolixibacter denitrificans TaxID=1541063 RepID=A0A2P8CE00_9BACT|nr:hypothetical protein CLV93_104120 [Prolixibacter denitrificans]GET21927.1 hypothetical protein JCM18694_21730 [Prolixibacter denitrificans]
MLPDIYLYNPTNELAIVNGDPNYMPPKRLIQFEKDLSTLPMFFASFKDVVLVHEVPSDDFLGLWARTGKELPVFVKEDEALNDQLFCQQPKGFLYPWGWSPAVHHRLEPLKDNCSDAFKNSPVANWKVDSRDIYSRKAAAGVLTKVLNAVGKNDWLLPEERCPVSCTELDEIIALQSRWGRLVVKSPWSASGRGIQMLRENEFNQSNQQVISGFLKQQGFVMVEPWLKKMADLSLQFYSEGKGEVAYRGQAAFLTDAAGRYQGNYIREIPPGLSTEEENFLSTYLPVVRQVLQEALSESDFSSQYYGWLGVDLLLYRDAENALRLHPCLEINSRYNMGALTLKLRELISPESGGRWEINFDKSGKFNRDMTVQMNRFPARIVDGKMVEGILPMVPPADSAQFSAWLKVERI